MSNHEPPFEFWKLDQKYLMILFHGKYTIPPRITLITFIAKDGSKSFFHNNPTYRGKYIYAHKLMGNKGILSGIHDLNQTFYYVDNDFNIFPAKKHETSGYTIACPYDPAYIIKIIIQNVTVSEINYI
ncbi:hypothetical protein RF11_09092 [Thelohanellus kitauei]|uniref:Uncharacterized protein n=1 Tax=Thelohanellus kitauei TaxID=669202 RepID=A0A0C2MNW0_THEKT|nr:hypothetical protein RF11_09092 [Thelohanellus kitauei]